MESSTWDFDAPGFVDFGANEHEEAIGRDSYFDHDHELIRDEGLSKELYTEMEIQKVCGKRLTFDTPSRVHSTKDVVSSSVNLSEGTEACQSLSGEKKEEEEIAIEANDEKLSSAAGPDVPPPANPTDEEKKDGNTVTDLPKNFADCIIGSALTAKTNKKTDWSSRNNTLRRSRRIAKTRPIEAANSDEPPSKKKNQLTQASTPTVLRRRGPVSSSMAIKSTAEMELAEVEKLKREQKRRLRENTKSLKVALAGPARPPSPAKFPKSKVEHKPKNQTGTAKRGQVSSEFPMKLRQYHTSKSPPKMTKVEPFHFSTRKRKFADSVRVENQGYRFQAGAKVHTNFETRQMKHATGNKREPMKAFPTITAAKTPKLMTKTRSRPVHVISNKEKEEMELEEIKKHTFKALPIDRKILEGPTSLPDVEKRGTTHPEEFHLHLDKRIKERPVPERSTSPSREFKAHAIPKSFYDGPSHLVKKHLATTVAQSPNFQLKKRMEISHAKKELKAVEEKENSQVHAVVTKAPVHKAEKKAVVTEKHTTQLQPFSFDKSDKERFSNKEARIEAIHEAVKQKANSFRAQPIAYEPNPLEALPPKNARPPTKAKPFHLESDSRGHVKEEKWKAQLKKEETELKSKTEFKANTEYQRIMSKCGFKPVLTERQNCDFEEFQLHTAARVVDRHEFDEKMKEKEALIMQRAKDVALNAEREAEEKARKQRKEAEHKAQPIRKYVPVVIKESTKLPTVAQSPHFSNRFYNNAKSDL